MWTLPEISEENKVEYKSLFLDKMKERRDKISNSSIKNYLTDELISRLLIEEPEELYGLKKDLQDNLFPNGDYQRWLDAEDSDQIKQKYKPILDVFDYTGFISNTKNLSYKISHDIININTCTYCNRQYIFTVKDHKGKIKAEKEKNKKLTKEEEKKFLVCRPDFDHYMPKGKFPFFAMSLHNLIPSCGICNSSCKLEEELPPDMNPHILRNLKEDLFKFSYTIDKNEDLEDIIIEEKHPKYIDGIDRYLEVFRTKEIYYYHLKLEVKELIDFAKKYKAGYLKNIYTQLGIDFAISKEEAYRMLLGSEMLAKNDNNRPLSKLKRDILRELGVID